MIKRQAQGAIVIHTFIIICIFLSLKTTSLLYEKFFFFLFSVDFLNFLNKHLISFVYTYHMYKEHIDYYLIKCFR